MITVTGLIILIMVALSIWFWESSMRAKELAITASKKACQQHQLQFLDGTAHFQKISVKRNQNRRVRWQRRYTFDYYDGQARLNATITIFDNQILAISLLPTAKNHPFENHTTTENNVIQFPAGKE